MYHPNQMRYIAVSCQNRSFTTFYLIYSIASIHILDVPEIVSNPCFLCLNFTVPIDNISAISLSAIQTHGNVKTCIFYRCATSVFQPKMSTDAGNRLSGFQLSLRCPVLVRVPIRVASHRNRTGNASYRSVY